MMSPHKDKERFSHPSVWLQSLGFKAKLVFRFLEDKNILKTISLSSFPEQQRRPLTVHIINKWCLIVPRGFKLMQRKPAPFRSCNWWDCVHTLMYFSAVLKCNTSSHRTHAEYLTPCCSLPRSWRKTTWRAWATRWTCVWSAPTWAKERGRAPTAVSCWHATMTRTRSSSPSARCVCV